IVLMDQLLWRPVIAWAEKFKFEQVEASQTPRSPILDLLRRSHLLTKIEERFIYPAGEALALRFARTHETAETGPKTSRKCIARILAVLAMGGTLFAIFKMIIMLTNLSGDDIGNIFIGAGATFLRVEVSLVLAALWTIPVGVYIGLRPGLSAVAQPIAQVAAS